MSYRFKLAEGGMGMGTVITCPDGWEPMSAMRYGETVVVFCREEIVAPTLPPAGNAPVLTSLNPNTLVAGGPPATVDVYGSNFDNSCQIMSDGTPRATFYFDTGHLQYTARPDLGNHGDVHQMTVVGTGGTSNALPLTLT